MDSQLPQDFVPRDAPARPKPLIELANASESPIERNEEVPSSAMKDVIGLEPVQKSVVTPTVETARRDDGNKVDSIGKKKEIVRPVESR